MPPTRPYSERFILAHGPGGTWNYTVPAGRRAIVTDLVILNVASAAANCILSLAGYTVYLAAVPGNYGTSHTSMRQVAYGLEVVAIVTGGSDMRASLSGYLLNEA